MSRGGSVTFMNARDRWLRNARPSAFKIRVVVHGGVMLLCRHWVDVPSDHVPVKGAVRWCVRCRKPRFVTWVSPNLMRSPW